MTTLPTVRVGQIWSDNDPRSAGRRIRIRTIDGDYAGVETINAVGGSEIPVYARRRTRVRLDRLVPGRTGYTLEEAPDGAA